MIVALGLFAALADPRALVAPVEAPATDEVVVEDDAAPTPATPEPTPTTAEPAPAAPKGPAETAEVGVVERREADPTVFPDPKKFSRGFFVEGGIGPAVPIGPTADVLSVGVSLGDGTGVAHSGVGLGDGSGVGRGVNAPPCPNAST